MSVSYLPEEWDGRDPPERGGWSVGAARAQMTRSTGPAPVLSPRARPVGRPLSPAASQTSLSRVQCRAAVPGSAVWPAAVEATSTRCTPWPPAPAPSP